MGIYLNPKNGGFAESIRSEIYVDKSGLIAYTNKCLNTKEKYICVSRPRRYTQALEGYAGEILLIGVAYDKNNKNKPHSCVIEKMVSGACSS